MYNIREKAILAKNISKSSYYSAKANEYKNKCVYYDLNRLEKSLEYLNKSDYFKNLRNGFNVNFFGVGTVISVGIGAYCTHNFCKDLINKFAEYYKNNAEKITNSYKEALSYFIDS